MTAVNSCRRKRLSAVASTALSHCAVAKITQFWGVYSHSGSFVESFGTFPNFASHLISAVSHFTYKFAMMVPIWKGNRSRTQESITSAPPHWIHICADLGPDSRKPKREQNMVPVCEALNALWKKHTGKWIYIKAILTPYVVVKVLFRIGGWSN